jgi:hypothetical protein
MTGTASFDGPRLPMPPGSNGSSTTSENVPGLPGIDITTRNLRASDTPNFWIRTPLAVSSDLDNVAVALRPMSAVSGSVCFDADPSKKTTKPPFYIVSLDPAAGSPGLGLPRTAVQPDAGDEFYIAGVAPAPYFLRVAPTGWMVKSISWSGRDYTFSPFDALSTPTIAGVSVVLTNATPSLTGIVTAADGAPRPGAVVLVFPADRSRWFNYGLKPPQFTTLVAGTNGAYATSALPAGDYFVVSVAGPPDEWMRPEFLDIAARSASRVTLSWGQSSTADLRMTEIRR